MAFLKADYKQNGGRSKAYSTTQKFFKCLLKFYLITYESKHQNSLQVAKRLWSDKYRSSKLYFQAVEIFEISCLCHPALLFYEAGRFVTIFSIIATSNTKVYFTIQK